MRSPLPVYQKQTYLSILYLLLSFPLGTAYFVFLVAGFSLGIGLTVVLVGFVVLLFVILASKGLVEFEKTLARNLLGVHLSPWSGTVTEQSVWERLLAELKNPATWKGLIYLALKFPLGIFSFVVAVTLIGLSLGMLSAPFIYQLSLVSFGPIVVDSLLEALVVCGLGVAVGLLSLGILTRIANVIGKVTVSILGD